MPTYNQYTPEELQTILETMNNFPKHATSLTIELRKGQTGGRIEKTNDGTLVYVPTQFSAPSTGWRD